MASGGPAIAKPEPRRRNPAFLRFVKMLPCTWRDLSRCDGVIEADHVGPRGLSRKSHDDETIPTCMLHHRQRTDHCGPFRQLARDVVRGRIAAAIESTQARYRASLVNPIPF